MSHITKQISVFFTNGNTTIKHTTTATTTATHDNNNNNNHKIRMVILLLNILLLLLLLLIIITIMIIATIINHNHSMNTPSPPTKSFPTKSPRVKLSGRLPIKLYGRENSHPLELRVCLSQTL